ncbi:DedA family protein [Sphingomonas sp. BT-65]|uniref:YqaA family protein n=1 Tax=Sphingomonas sp. BT-65 TaxID=2989821 RepID=UPI0022362932|nr:YqaA family protein [Sphingomonas sp. BT-65]MCW4463142.1 DedA family protein [Sphingomonas sp. BT-65]
MFRALYDWTLRLAGHRHADRYMAAVSFAESSFFPIPPDVMLVPMILARREKAYWIATICTIASILGGMFGYAIGYFLYESVGQWLIAFYGLAGKMDQFRQWYAEWGAAIILIKGLTPIPFKLVTIASGLAEFNFPIFVVTATITRAARFFLVAFLLKKFGEPVQKVIEERLNLIGWIVLAALIGGFALVALI